MAARCTTRDDCKFDGALPLGMVERLHRDRNIPYIKVDEPKRALFASTKLRSFHFVGYWWTRLNWLISAANRFAG